MTTDKAKTIYDQIDTHADQLDDVLTRFGRNLVAQKPFFSEQDSAEVANSDLEAAAKHAAGVILLGYVQLGKLDAGTQPRLIATGMAAAEGLSDEEIGNIHQSTLMLELIAQVLSSAPGKPA